MTIIKIIGEKSLAREVADCIRVYCLQNNITGKAICVGFTKKTPPDIPLGDVIHVCGLEKAELEESIEKKKCCPKHMMSFTTGEAINVGVSLIRAATFQEAEERHERHP